MKFFGLVLLSLAFILLSCNLEAAPLWEAAPIANSQNAEVQLKDQTGKVLRTVKTSSVKAFFTAKSKVEIAAGAIRPQVYIDGVEQPNAFATYSTNGQPMIAINVGMLKVLGEDEEAYAALVGHELAHLYLGHIAQSAKRNGLQQFGSFVLGFALGYAGVPAGGTIADVATTAVSTVFSRDNERDADTEGMKYMLRAGYDPYGAVRMQEKLASASSGFSIPFLSTHPSGSERIKNMRMLVDVVSSKPSNLVIATPEKAESAVASNPPPEKAESAVASNSPPEKAKSAVASNSPSEKAESTVASFLPPAEKNTKSLAAQDNMNNTEVIKQKLRELKMLNKEGLISNDEYSKKRKQLLENF